MYHWGFYDAPTVGWCSADPEVIRPQIVRPQRFRVTYARRKFVVFSLPKTKMLPRRHHAAYLIN